MKLLNFTIIKLTTCLVSGILLGYFTAIPLPTILYATVFLCLLLTITYFISKRKTRKTIWFGIVGFLTMISIGVLVTNLHNEQLDRNNYTNVNTDAQHITFRIRSALKPSLYHDKYIVSLLKIDTIPVTGKALLNIAKDSLTETLAVDNVYITSSGFQPITLPKHPHQFNYKKYLERQYVYKQLYVKPEGLFRVSENKHTVFGFADLIRTRINNKLKENNFKPDVLAIINALLLGQRQHLSKAIYNHYTDAGAVHILAVSGLHVGIILLLLNVVFKPLKRFKYGKTTTIVLVVTILWCFAIIAGLTASVTRAVTMFSIIAIGMHLKKPTNIYNTLAISIFVLLLCKPLFLFDVGFQLSYLAVIAIVALQPHLQKLWQPKNLILRKGWGFFTVGIAAQCGVLPISLYYFHQFPGLFFVANIVIIPFLGIILGLGIFVIILALCNALPPLLVDVFSAIISGMNYLMKWVALQDHFLFKDIAFNGWQVITAYLFTIALVQLALYKKYKWLRLTLVSVLLFQGVSIYNKYKSSATTLTVFHKSRHTIIGKKTQQKLAVYSSLDSLAQFNNVRAFSVGNRILETQAHRVPSFLHFKNRIVLIVDSMGVYKTTRLKPKYILLTQSPRINLLRLIDSIKPAQIIADGSNYKSYVSRWKATCLKQKIPFHYTGEKGAFVME